MEEAKLKILAARQLKKAGLEGPLSVKHCCGVAKGMEVWFVRQSIPWRAELLEGELVALENLDELRKKA